MRRYETIFITDPDIPEDVRIGVFEKTKTIIAEMNGFLAGFEEWGGKKMAYPIMRKNRGYYVRLDYCGDGALVNELERSFRIDDRVLRFLTVLIEERVDLDALKRSLEEIEAAKKAATDQQAEESNPADVAPEAAATKNEGTDTEDTETVETEKE